MKCKGLQFSQIEHMYTDFFEYTLKNTLYFIKNLYISIISELVYNYFIMILSSV